MNNNVKLFPRLDLENIHNINRDCSELRSGEMRKGELRKGELRNGELRKVELRAVTFPVTQKYVLILNC